MEEQVDREELPALGQRVKKIRRELNLSQQDFAKELGISGSFLSEIEKGKVKPGYDFTVNIAKVCRVNLYFLFFGQGDMFLELPADSAQAKHDPQGRIKDFSDVLWYAERSPMLKHTLMGFAAKFIYENKAFIESEIENLEDK